MFIHVKYLYMSFCSKTMLLLLLLITVEFSSLLWRDRLLCSTVSRSAGLLSGACTQFGRTILLGDQPAVPQTVRPLLSAFRSPGSSKSVPSKTRAVHDTVYSANSRNYSSRILFRISGRISGTSHWSSRTPSSRTRAVNWPCD
jgi:hypothetical protein